MTWWLVDNIALIYFLLGLAALVVIVLFYQNKRGRELLALAVILGLAFLFWLLTAVTVTDRKQIELNMHALAQAALNNKPDQVTPQLASDFTYGGLSKPQIGDYVTAHARMGGVSGYNISSFNVDKLDKDRGNAEASFMLAIDHSGGKAVFRCKTIFVIEDTKWRLQKIVLYNPVVDSDKPMHE